MKTDSAALFEDCLVASVCSTRAISAFRSSIERAEFGDGKFAQVLAKLVALGFLRRRGNVVGVHGCILASCRSRAKGFGCQFPAWPTKVKSDAARDHDRHRSEGSRRPRSARAGDATAARAGSRRGPDRGRGCRHQSPRRAPAPGTLSRAERRLRYSRHGGCGNGRRSSEAMSLASSSAIPSARSSVAAAMPSSAWRPKRPPSPCRKASA